MIFANGLGSGRLAGQGLCALMTLAFAGMVVLQRRQPGASMIAVNALGALGSGMFGLMNSSRPPLGPYDLGVLFVFGLTTIGLAFVLFMEGAKLHSLRRGGPHQPARRCAGADLGVSCFRREPWPGHLLGGAIVLGRGALAHRAGSDAGKGYLKGGMHG